jgi:RNA polymerase sigma-70 factor (ECF subfamily)
MALVEISNCDTMVRMEDHKMDAADESGSFIVDDETLLGLISSHDEGALWSLYERYSRLLYSIALRITGDSGIAEECTQDVFQSVWLRAAQFRPSAGSVQSWLSAIARHRAIDEVRSKWHRACQTERSFEGLPDFQAAVGRGWEQLSLLRTDLHAALAALPFKQRQAIELAFYGGLTTNEIALRLGESAGTIKSRLRLGLDRLRDAANAWWEGT